MGIDGNAPIEAKYQQLRDGIIQQDYDISETLSELLGFVGPHPYTSEDLVNLAAERIIELEKEVKRLHEALVETKENMPWPKEIWPMEDLEYVKAVPSPRIRTAVSGFLMREGWRMCLERINFLMIEEEYEWHECMDNSNGLMRHAEEMGTYADYLEGEVARLKHEAIAEKLECPYCYGYVHNPDDGQPYCPACGGDGIIKPYDLADYCKGLEKKLNSDRCSDCGGELSCCGEMTEDGPSMDCRVCQMEEEIRNLRGEEEPIVIRDVTDEQAREEILAAIEDADTAIYYSDLEEILLLDYEQIMHCCQNLLVAGKIKFDLEKGGME